MLHAAQLPDPGALARKLATLASAPPPVSPAGTGTAATGSEAQAPDFAALVRDVDQRGHALAASIFKLQVRPISLEHGLLRYSRPGCCMMTR